MLQQIPNDLAARLTGRILLWVAGGIIVIIALFGSVTRITAGEIGVVKHFGAINTDNPSSLSRASTSRCRSATRWSSSTRGS